MKKIFYPVLFLLAFAMQSCSDGLDRHELRIVYPNSYALYADQTQDSLLFLTFDSWKATSNASWISIVGKSSETIKYDYYRNYLIRVDLALETNTTGHTRMGNVKVKSYDYEGAGLYVQFPFLNILRPNPNVNNYFGDHYTVPDGADFILTDSDYTVRDSLCFNVQKDWSLAFAPGADQSWLKVSSTSGSQGYNVVSLSLEQNLATEERKTKLILTSSGGSNEISIVQMGIPKNLSN